jgi:hypothetical protein
MVVLFLASPSFLCGFFSSIRETLSTSRRAGFNSVFAAASGAACSFVAGTWVRAGLEGSSAFLAGAAILALTAAGLGAAEAFAVLGAAGFRAGVLLVVFVGIPVSKNFAHGWSGVNPKPYYCATSSRCTAS